jgi:hypothetical protein
VGGVDVEEDARDDDGVFFEEFFEECLYARSARQFRLRKWEGVGAWQRRGRKALTKPLLIGAGSFSKFNQI